MCGRYSMAVPGDVVAELLGLVEVPDLEPRWNVAPTQHAPVVRREPDGARRIAMLRWGLVPPWARDVRIGSRMINARSETAASKPSFRAAFRARRCVVVADAWYEWRATPGGKVPTRIHRAGDGPIWLAGLWEARRRKDSEDGPALLETFTVLTTSPVPSLRGVHDRMPCALRTADVEQWLDPAASRGALEGLLSDPEHAGWASHAVSTHVNSPRNDDPRCAVPVDL